MKEHLKSGPLSLADLGCGNGTWFKILEREGYIGSSQPVYAIDLEAQRLRRVANRFPYLRVLQAPGDAVPQIGGGTLDFLISTMVLEHVPGQRKFLGEIHRMLKPGGKAYITTVFKKRWAWYFRKRNGESVLDTSHLREYTDLEAFRGLVADSGLRVLNLQTELLWFPLFDPLLFRVLPKQWALDSPLIRTLGLEKFQFLGITA